MDDATAELLLSLDLGGESPGRPRWQARAACRGSGPDQWFQEQGGTQDQSFRQVCGECPVRAECLEMGLTMRLAGIWGGTTATERRQLRRSSTAA